MIPMRLFELADLLGCRRPGSDAEILDVVTDSREARPGVLFAALPGEHFDGHDFCGSAVSLGAEGLLVSRPVEVDTPQLVVDDVLLALGDIARRVREKVAPAVVGITGSNGKTTVKEMVAAILRQQGEVLATGGNFNNELGLPLTLFRLTPEHRYAVLEMGAGQPGDIVFLARFGRPEVGWVNIIAPAHLEPDLQAHKILNRNFVVMESRSVARRTFGDRQDNALARLHRGHGAPAGIGVGHHDGVDAMRRQPLHRGAGDAATFVMLIAIGLQVAEMRRAFRHLLRRDFNRFHACLLRFWFCCEQSMSPPRVR